MSLIDQIRMAQRDAGEAAVMADLKRKGLLIDEPKEPTMTTNTTQQALNAALAECERLRAALEEFVSIVGTEAGFETAMTESDDAFTEFLNKQQARVDSAVANASALLDAARGKP